MCPPLEDLESIPERTEPLPPSGFEKIFRTSPMLDALGSFFSLGSGKALRIGVLIVPAHLNARESLHGGVIATLADVGMGYLLGASSDIPIRLVTLSLHVDFLDVAQLGAWLEVFLDEPRITNRFAFAASRLVSDGRLIARASGVFSVIKPTN